MAERVRQLLDKEVEWEVSVGQVSDAVRKLLELVKSDVPMRNMFLRAAPTNTLFELKGKMPVGAWLQAIEDSDPDAVIVVREYGLLVTNKDRVPAGAIGVSELWKMKRADAKEKK